MLWGLHGECWRLRSMGKLPHNEGGSVVDEPAELRLEALRELAAESHEVRLDKRRTLQIVQPGPDTLQRVGGFVRRDCASAVSCCASTDA